jgi:hypothetical protein
MPRAAAYRFTEVHFSVCSLDIYEYGDVGDLAYLSVNTIPSLMLIDEVMNCQGSDTCFRSSLMYSYTFILLIS